MIGAQLGSNPGAIGEDVTMLACLYAAATLFLFGIWFNGWVAKQEESGSTMTAAWVVIGVFVTLVVSATVEVWALPGVPGVVIALGGFACSGAPMAYGSYKRHDERQKDDKDVTTERARLAQERHNADKA